MNSDNMSVDCRVKSRRPATKNKRMSRKTSTKRSAVTKPAAEICYTSETTTIDDDINDVLPPKISKSDNSAVAIPENISFEVNQMHSVERSQDRSYHDTVTAAKNLCQLPTNDSGAHVMDLALSAEPTPLQRDNKVPTPVQNRRVIPGLSSYLDFLHERLMSIEASMTRTENMMKITEEKLDTLIRLTKESVKSAGETQK